MHGAPSLDETKKLSIEIDPDAEISLQISAGTRINVQLLGRVPGHYLVIRGSALDGLRFNYGDSVILRYLRAGVVCAFRALVLKMALTPERLLFVSYPRSESVRQHPLRSAPRLSCTLPGRVTRDESTSSGLVVDLSETGCQFIVPLNTAAPDELTEADDDGQDVSLELVNFDDCGEMRLEGTIRRTVEVGRYRRLGIQFKEPQPEMFARVVDLLHLAEAGSGADGRWS